MSGEGALARRIDETVLARLVADLGADDVAEVCDVFLADARELLAALRAAYDSRDAVPLARTAHRLKSASGFVGAELVVALSRELERAATEHRLDGIGRHLELVTEELDRLSHELVPVVRDLSLAPNRSGEVRPGAAGVAPSAP